MRILLIEDDEFVLAYLKALLERQQHTVVIKGSAEEGIHAFESAEFDAVITDMNLPGMSGTDVIKTIRRLEPKVRIIAISGDIQCDILLRSAGVFGADCTLRKPIHQERLLAALGTGLA